MSNTRNAQRRIDDAEPESNCIKTETPSVLLRSHGDRVDRQDAIRLMLRTLKDFGLESTFSTLEKESGEMLESESLECFRAKVDSGDWDEAVALVERLSWKSSKAAAEAKFMVVQQKFYELIDEAKEMEALHCLKQELSQLTSDHGLISELATDLVTGPEPCNGSTPHTFTDERKLLWSDLEQLLTPRELVRPNRFAMLVSQAIKQQEGQLPHFNPLEGEVCHPILEDISVDQSSLPSRLLATYTQHTDEVLAVSFSPCGSMLATGGADGLLILWEVCYAPNVSQHESHLKVLSRFDHSNPVHHIVWGRMGRILICGGSPSASLWWNWDDPVGYSLFTTNRHSREVTGVGFIDSSDDTFVTCSLDKTVNLWHATRGYLMTIDFGVRVTAMVLSCDLENVAFVGGHQELLFYSIQATETSVPADENGAHEVHDATTRQSTPPTDEATSSNRQFSLACIGKAAVRGDPIVSVRASSTNPDQFLLVTHSGDVLLWSFSRKHWFRAYGPVERKHFIIQPTFGGHRENLVACGGEDFSIRIWNKSTGDEVTRLDGHAGTVNCLSWSPTHRSMIVTASDDHTIRMWL